MQLKQKGIDLKIQDFTTEELVNEFNLCLKRNDIKHEESN